MKSAKGKGSRAPLYRLIHKHLGVDPLTLTVLTRTFPLYHRVNLELAIQAWSGLKGNSYKIDGLVVQSDHEGVSLSRLANPDAARRYLAGPIVYQDAPLADGQSLTCVKRGLYRLKSKSGALVMLVTQNPHQYPPAIDIEVMAAERSIAEDFVRDLSIATERAPAFRGQVISLEMDCHRQMSVVYHRLPEINADQIILPPVTLQRIDRHARVFNEHRKTLSAAGRHLKRGVLLHGPPGTGKTLSAMYLAAQMPGRTVIMLTGGGMSSIETSGAMARALAPATIILEDVDLIGTMREHQSVGANALLFELLNQMDGLAEDIDVLFVLTTNRPDVLEPALASRPGRIDQAIEIPLPDAQCRRRLFDLYSKGLDTQIDDLDSIIQRLKGVSAAFIRELLRKAALLALEMDSGEPLIVRRQHIERAIDELLVAGGPLTQRLLGVGGSGASVAD